MTPRQAFDEIAKRFKLSDELPESTFEYENAPESSGVESSANVRTLRETPVMCTSIIPDRASLSQAVKNFRKAFPHHAEDRDRLKTAQKLVKAGLVYVSDLQANAYTIPGQGREFFIANKRCTCERSLKNQLCEHRIAVVLAVDADKILMAKRMQQHEHHAIQHEEQDASDDAHAEHGSWSGPILHQCADGEVTALAPVDPGTPIECPRCKQPYCPACDQESAQ
ncbi:MAG: hypothetical protein HY868_24300 [Chloroflexi bacterium]|nr:hypothetical protein [Chloroflexota bacterium]